MAVVDCQRRAIPVKNNAVSKVTWAVWHVPQFQVAGNTNPCAWFLLDTIAKAVLFTWVYNNTNGSLLIAALFHAVPSPSTSSGQCLLKGRRAGLATPPAGPR